MCEQLLLERSHARSAREVVSTEPELMQSELDRLMPPYSPPVSGPSVDPLSQPRVTMSTAIALVNRYCAKLPSDIFTRLSPNCDVKELPAPDGMRRYQAQLMLPINSPLKDTVIGPILSRPSHARMAVALEVCMRVRTRVTLDCVDV
jgi:endoribonuclease Dicer